MMRAVLDSSVHLHMDLLERRVSQWTLNSRHRGRIQVNRSWSRPIFSDNIGTTGRRQIPREVLDLVLAGNVVGTGRIGGEGRGGKGRVIGRQHEGSGQRFCRMSDWRKRPSQSRFEASVQLKWVGGGVSGATIRGI